MESEYIQSEGSDDYDMEDEAPRRQGSNNEYPIRQHFNNQDYDDQDSEDEAPQHQGSEDEYPEPQSSDGEDMKGVEYKDGPFQGDTDSDDDLSNPESRCSEDDEQDGSQDTNRSEKHALSEDEEDDIKEEGEERSEADDAEMDICVSPTTDQAQPLGTMVLYNFFQRQIRVALDPRFGITANRQYIWMGKPKKSAKWDSKALVFTIWSQYER